jgi:hypothetical protein
MGNELRKFRLIEGLPTTQPIGITSKGIRPRDLERYRCSNQPEYHTAGTCTFPEALPPNSVHPLMFAFAFLTPKHAQNEGEFPAG